MANLNGNNPRKWWKHTIHLLGQTSGQHEALKTMAINEYDGNIKLVAETINKVYQSVTCGLEPLDKSKLPQPTEHTPSQYIISLGTVEKRLMKVTIYKAVGPDMIPNWVLRDLCSLISGRYVLSLTAPSERAAFRTCGKWWILCHSSKFKHLRIFQNI